MLKKGKRGNRVREKMIFGFRMIPLPSKNPIIGPKMLKRALKNECQSRAPEKKKKEMLHALEKGKFFSSLLRNDEMREK